MTFAEGRLSPYEIDASIMSERPRAATGSKEFRTAVVNLVCFVKRSRSAAAVAAVALIVPLHKMEVEATDDVVPMGGVAPAVDAARPAQPLQIVFQSKPLLGRACRSRSEIRDLEAELQAIAVAPSMPFEAIVHIKNNSATLNLISPWKVLGHRPRRAPAFILASGASSRIATLSRTRRRCA